MPGIGYMVDDPLSLSLTRVASVSNCLAKIFIGNLILLQLQ